MQDYLERLKSGSLKLYALEKELPPPEAVRIRRTYIEQVTGSDLRNLGSYTIGIDECCEEKLRKHDWRSAGAGGSCRSARRPRRICRRGVFSSARDDGGGARRLGQPGLRGDHKGRRVQRSGF